MFDLGDLFVSLRESLLRGDRLAILGDQGQIGAPCKDFVRGLDFGMVGG